MLTTTLFLQSLNITATFLPSNPRNLSIELPPLKQIKKQGSGILKLPIARQSSSSLARRQDSNILYNVGNSYLITCEIGTPGQQVFTLLDTGSSDLWVDPTCANSYNPSYCAAFPVYVPGQSSTAADTGKPFSLQYATGSATGEYLLDTVALGNANLLNQQFGYSENSTFPPTGIMGVGLGYGFGLDYYNIVDQLFRQGYTNSRAFSLDLASVDVSQGAIIFGGIDTNKYYGTLAKRPIIPYTEAPDGFPRYWLYLTSVGITEQGATASNVLSGSGYTQPIFLDSGATLSQLPQTLFDALIAFFPTAVDTGSGLYSIDCSIRSQAGTLDFGFGPNIVKVPYHEWFYQAGQTCYFGGQPSTTIWSFGGKFSPLFASRQEKLTATVYLDSFLRSAYVVYDQDNFNIHIAQAANCGANVVTIGTGVDAVPSIAGCTSTGATSSSSLASSASTVAPTTTSSTSTSTSPSSIFVTSTSTSTSTTPISTLETTTPTIPRPSITPTSTVEPSTSSTADSSTPSTLESVTPTIPGPSTTPSSALEPTLSTPTTLVSTTLPSTAPTSTPVSTSPTSSAPVATSTPSISTGSSTTSSSISIPSMGSSSTSSISSSTSGTSTFSTSTSSTSTTSTTSTAGPSTLTPTTTRPTVTYLIRPTTITSSAVDRIETAAPNARRRSHGAPFWRKLVGLRE